MVNGEDDANLERMIYKFGAARFSCHFFSPQVLMAFSSRKQENYSCDIYKLYGH